MFITPHILGHPSLDPTEQTMNYPSRSAIILALAFCVGIINGQTTTVDLKQLPKDDRAALALRNAAAGMQAGGHGLPGY